VTGNWASAAVMCVTGAAGYALSGSEEGECLVWLAGAFASAKLIDRSGVAAGVAGCIAGAISTNEPSIVYAPSGKE
jgi:di/tricarboxylate transporter